MPNPLDCPCVRAEKPVAPCGENCFHFGKGPRRCVHCGQHSEGLVKDFAALAAAAGEIDVEAVREFREEGLLRWRTEPPDVPGLWLWRSKDRQDLAVITEQDFKYAKMYTDPMAYWGFHRQFAGPIVILEPEAKDE